PAILAGLAGPVRRATTGDRAAEDLHALGDIPGVHLHGVRPEDGVEHPSRMIATAWLAGRDMETLSLPRSGRMNSNWIATPIRNIAGTVTAFPSCFHALRSVLPRGSGQPAQGTMLWLPRAFGSTCTNCSAPEPP